MKRSHLIVLKSSVYQHLMQEVDSKIDVLNSEIRLLDQSRDNNTKSSAGDKYETDRSMVLLEIEKFHVQLNNLLNQRKHLLQIDISRENNKVDNGSFVITDKGKYFFSIGLGKLTFNQDEFFCISMASPIGKVLYNKSSGDVVDFQGQQITIEKIV